MQTLLPNSKKCSATPDRGLVFGIAFFAALSSLAATPSVASVPRSTLTQDIQGRKSSSFEPILKRWASLYGTSAAPSLLEIASDSKLEDSDRYIALMGFAKLSGTKSSPLVSRFLKDKSWMLRTGALRALSAFKESSNGEAILPLLHDSALVVRSEALNALQTLRPARSTEALIEVLVDRTNYHGGKAQWVPQKALHLLVQLQPEKNPANRPLSLQTAIKPYRKLNEVFSLSQDEAFLGQAVRAMEKLTGHFLKPTASVSEKAAAWKTALQQ